MCHCAANQGWVAIATRWLAAVLLCAVVGCQGFVTHPARLAVRTRPSSAPAENRAVRRCAYVEEPSGSDPFQDPFGDGNGQLTLPELPAPTAPPIGRAPPEVVPSPRGEGLEPSLAGEVPSTDVAPPDDDLQPEAAAAEPDGQGGPCPAAAAELAQAKKLDRHHQDACVDHYYRAALAAWEYLAQAAAPDTADEVCESVLQLYGRSLAGLIDAGQRYHRFDPRSHLLVDGGAGPMEIPITSHGLVWQADDYCQLLPAARCRSREISHHYASPGLGVPLVAVRTAAEEERFSQRRQPFAVTAVLRPCSSLPAGAAAADRPDAPAVLEFYNPYVVETIDVYGAPVALARDLSAPWAWLYRTQPPVIVQGFINPDDSRVQPKLLMLEPYQPGKIPVLFIHGLASSPLAWFNAVNELAAHHDLYQHYQFWAYRYPTGGAILESAAALREDLYDVRDQFDPGHHDAALDEMVVVAHSLGGLMTKLQITDSGEILWNRLARQPLDSVQAPPEVQDALARAFYFEPVPMIRRAVFAGTPFHGSSWATRSVGRVSSSFVRFAGVEEVAYKQLMRANRDVFDRYLWRKRPTSIDLLEPSSPVLAALAQMPINPQVTLHTIIGTGMPHVLREPSDGVVAMSSAEHPGTVSELHVPALHMQLHNVPETFNELVRILRLHLEELPAGAGPELAKRPVEHAAR